MSPILKVLLDSADTQVAFLYKNLKRELISLIMVLAVHSPDKFWSIPVPEYNTPLQFY
jgi:L-arabinose isomerase